MAQNMATVRSLFIPVEQVTLLLPGTVVAEIVPYADSQPPGAGAPEWLLGSVLWREQQIPLVSIDTFMTGEPSPAGGSARIAVLKALSNRSDMPYFGIVTKQIPRLLTVYQEGVEPENEGAAGLPGVAAELRVNGEQAIVPDLDAIEAALTAELAKLGS
jgi:chemosensory pili system protein ChpC